MSDNVGYTPGTGASIAADNVGGVLVQRVKPVFGADGVATDVSAADPLPVDAGLPALASRVPANTTEALPVRMIGQDMDQARFSGVGSGLLSSFFAAPAFTSGTMAVSQSSGSLVVTSGTTANSEFLARSVNAYRGAIRLRWSTILSQRIANNNFAVLLADLIGAGLAVTVNSATSITVTKAAHGFTSANVGQFMLIGGISGVAGVPGRYAIASVPTADTINFTVAGWPGSGSGTLTLFGWNYIRNLYTGTTATNMAGAVQADGWSGLGDTTLTISTTASAGHVGQATIYARELTWMDGLRASASSVQFTSRGNRVEDLPDENTELYVFLWAWNGTTNPSSTTTWTMGHVSVEKMAAVGVRVEGLAPWSATVQPSVIVSSGAVNALLQTGSLLVGDVGLQVRANATGAASIHHFVAAGTTNAANIKASAGRVLGWSLANTTASWRYVKLHNTAGTPTAGSGVVLTIGIPPNGVAQQQVGQGLGFATGIARTCVTGAADADATAVTANDVVGDIFFA